MRLFKTTLILIVSMAAADTRAFAQGANDCGNAQVISGTGLFSFDNTSANIDGPADCPATNGLEPVRKDVWFSWTAPATDLYQISTCSLTSFGTRLAVYEGSTCPPTVQINCVGAVCLPDQSRVTFPTIAGQQYQFRIGSRQVGVSGMGMFEVALAPICLGVPDDNLEPNDSCAVGVSPMTNGTTTGLFVRKFAEDWYSMEVASGATLNVDAQFVHANGDIDIELRGTCGGPVLKDSKTGTDNEGFSWTNTGTCQSVYLRVYHFTQDPNSDCSNYDLTIGGAGTCTSTGVGTNYCTSVANSTGNSAGIDAMGSPMLSAQDVTLRATGVPNNSAGMFFFGANQMQAPFGLGIRCVGKGKIHRMPPFAVAGPANGSPAGEATLDINFGASYGALIVPGQLNFQYWFQDNAGGGTTFNLTNGLQIQFQ